MKPVAPTILASVEATLAGALALPDASLVILRRGVLVEFKTAMLLPGLAASLEGGGRSWQIGPFEGHHCHLDLASVQRVCFDAEPVACQGGRLNYTVWFLSAGDCGNPFRADGLFSVTLNAPYRRDHSARVDLIESVYALHDLQRDGAGVFASDAFLAARPAGSAANRDDEAPARWMRTLPKGVSA
jgi:hypothetical protein